ncbi:MAG: ABC transporter ATP-binding protein [Planctomycetes bacterium]|nr:ABC transporter ATP-binding protein [Planctomycetota bacterium]
MRHIVAESQFAIETIALTKVFPDWWGRSRVVAVDNLNLRIRTNEIYGFLGPNGSGKTTTIKMLLNLLHPTSGAAVVLGGSSSEAAVSSRIGYLPEDSYLYRYLTAYETLDFYGRLFGLPSSIRKLRIETLLDMVGLAGVGNRQVGTFSKGMARRIGLAGALINDPDLLILDEPTSGMDPMGTRQIKDLLVELARRGKTILLCSHLLADVEDICDRIGILYGGKMQVEGSVRELLEQTGETQIRTHSLNESATQRIRQILEEEQGECEITHPMDKLESFFVRVVAKAQQEMQLTSGAGAGAGISGFLADKEIVRQLGILEQLVSAEPVQNPTITEADAVTIQTQLRPVTESSSPDNSLLRTLTASKTEVPLSGKMESSPSGAAQQPKPAEAVKKDILEDLLGRGKKTDGTTTPTDSKTDGETAE